MLKSIGTIFSLIAAVLVLYCGNDKLTTGIDPQIPEYAGSWKGTFAAIPGLLNESLDIAVQINMDSSYFMDVVYAASKDTAFKNIGRWAEADSNRIVLNGSSCSIFDTTLNELRVLNTCGDPAKIKINITDNVWTIPLGDLAMLGPAFGIDFTNPLIAQILKNPALVIQLTRQL